MIPACAGLPASPSDVSGAGGASGSSVAVVDVGRYSSPSDLVTVTVRYELAGRVENATVWACLARTPETIILSSCKGVDVAAPSGTVKTTVGIYYVNSVPVVTETRYIASFLTSGDIVRRRTSYPPLELAWSALTSAIHARQQVEHLWQWHRLGGN
jgi:hypothetical protein